MTGLLILLLLISVMVLAERLYTRSLEKEARRLRPKYPEGCGLSASVQCAAPWRGCECMWPGCDGLEHVCYCGYSWSTEEETPVQPWMLMSGPSPKFQEAIDRARERAEG